ncbi:MAG: homoserine O-acetyltransferase [Methanohalobium sp.]|uniref:homoserine O-acetyltransferase MetX n=1 Tax=Methanohalobium sp. TaxID=2837493 RepID=UPI00397E4AF8
MKYKSIGDVETQYYRIPDELILESGKKIKDVTLAFETYGTLNWDKSNAILVCHTLTGDAHAAGWHEGDRKPGWWDIIIGPGKALDTQKYFVICSNVIGGCKGSTGPSSINPDTKEPYGLDFPVVTIKDMVNAQKKLVDYLGISKLFAVVGGSMGGLQVLQWSVSYPEMVKKAIPIATAGYSTPQQIAFNEVGRIAIVSDPNWNSGDYYGGKQPTHGLALARMIGHITYLSDDSMHQKFGRRLQNKNEYEFDFSREFEVESYLHYQGLTFTERFDANSYLYLTKAVDYFDLTENNSLAEGLRDVEAKFLVISFTSDWLYPPYQLREIVMSLSANNADVTYREIESNYGHDSFLLESGQLNYVINNFLSHTYVSDIMIENIATISEGISIDEAARVMFEKEITHLPLVYEDGKLAGIVTSWDISKSIALKSSNLDEIMTKNVITARPDEPIEKAAEKMESRDISALPVIDKNKRVIGMVTSEDISRLIEEF